MNNFGFPTTFRNGHSGAFLISGMKFNDLNNDSAKDANETGLPGWRIELLLDGKVIDATKTAQDGSYSFDHLAPGSYTVREVPQAGWIQTCPPGGSHSVTLTGADSVGNDFGNHKTEPVDTKPPEITSFDFNPKEIDAWNSSQEITIIANITDDLSGFALSEMRFYSPSGDQYVDGEIVNFGIIFPPHPVDLVRSGTYDTKIEVHRYSEKGTWELSYLTLADNAGNEVRLEKDDLKALGFPVEFEVVSECDREPPNILSFDINPRLIDTSNSSQEITVTAHLTDDLSGLTSAESCFSNPSEWLTCCHGAGCHQHSEDDWCYERKIEYSQGSSEGTWELRSFNFEDAVGNKRQLSKEEMENLGFPTEFRNLPSNKRFPGLKIEKNASSSIFAPGDLVNYTIIYTNTGDVDLTEVVITERYPAGVEFISASPDPDPGTNNRWTVGDLPALERPRKIAVTLRVSELQDLEFAGEGQIVGEGFVNVRGSLSTSRGPLELKNVVTITSAETGPASAAASVKVGEPGTELETREHGSGAYDSEEMVRMRTENKSISMEKDVSATYAPTTLGLYRNRTVVYTSKWTEEARAKNRITGASTSESYRRATSIDRESRLFLDENESVMEIEAEFDGMGHFGFLKKSDPEDSAQGVPTFESREDYIGSFKVLERTDEYGTAVSSEKAVSGAGQVVVDKRVGDVQRSYESGSGSYDSEELIETNTNYIAKDISVVHGPMNQSLTYDVSIASSMKWKEGMYSKTAGTSLIGEEYTGVTQLDKETVALGLNEMDTEANFSGRASYRAVLRDEVDFDEQYEGDYSLQRRILFTGVPKYDRPHLNVTKTLDGVVEETEFDAKEETLAGESRNKVIKVATYTITIENDGNKALGPIYVKDIFPPKAVYINASVRPSELTDSYANWTLTHLAIGDVSTIVLNLDVTKHVPAELVNRVEVCGGYDGDEQVCASNFSALEVEWLTCCPNETISVRKTGQGASSAKNRVLYRIEVENRANVTRAAKVTDSLPEGMVLLDARVPFASYENETVVWNLANIGPFETVTIDYLAEALWSGRFVNSVEVEARSVDGQIVQPVRAECVVEIGEFGGKKRPAGWQPPDWGFVSVCDENCELTG